MFDNHCSQSIEFVSPETTRLREVYRIEPELSDPVIPLNMDVRRFRSFEAVE